MLVDSHVNLHAEAFDEDRDAVLARAREAGVTAMLAICSRWCDLDTVAELARAHADLHATAGAHPHHAKDEPSITIDEIVARADRANAVAIGETGLDKHYNYSPIEDQIASFRAHIGAARALNLPLIVHTREADDDTAEILEEEYAKGEFPILMHCYTSGRDLAERAAALGAYFSVNGIATFKNAVEVRQVIIDVMPRDRVILETDAPYLTPVPHRGRRNEPSYLPLVAAKLGELYGWTGEETATRTTEAFQRLFTKAPVGTAVQA